MLAPCASQARACMLALCHSDALFQRSHLKLHTSHCTLHTSDLHLTLRTSSHLISSELFSPHLSSSLLVSYLFSFVIEVLLNYFHIIRALLNLSHLTEALLNSSPLSCTSESSYCQRGLLHRKTVARRKLFAKRSFCTQKLETQMHLHRKASTNSEAFTHRKLLLREAFIDGCVYTQEAFTQRSF